MFYEVVLDDFRGSANCKKKCQLQETEILWTDLCGGKIFPLSPPKIYNPIFIK